MWPDGMGSERRAFERVPVRCPVRFRAAEDGTLAEGSTKDISDAGLGLFTREELRPQMHLEMWIKLRPRIGPIHITGRVVWSQQTRPDLWRAGICFEEMAFTKVVQILVSKTLDEEGR